ncbi:hypothetical protein DSO57_1020830 [Entomophthora muscae]|uniref:Uncharacterized protein n=1 Tax=Entomophthora muscae TaxID=34485 RepID=A0ACC2TED4_9FUNG|nr:hypothetical protein DSO57_1020830 [Entomophthora muscae]
MVRFQNQRSKRVPYAGDASDTPKLGPGYQRVQEPSFRALHCSNQGKSHIMSIQAILNP